MLNYFVDNFLAKYRWPILLVFLSFAFEANDIFTSKPIQGLERVSGTVVKFVHSRGAGPKTADQIYNVTVKISRDGEFHYPVASVMLNWRDKVLYGYGKSVDVWVKSPYSVCYFWPNPREGDDYVLYIRMVCFVWLFFAVCVNGGKRY